ncbi:MAG: TatD family hydrolase [Deferribacterales bacterium]
MILEKEDSQEYKFFITELEAVASSGYFFTDTHAHFHFNEFEEIENFLRNCRKFNVGRVLTVGIDLEDSFKAKELSDGVDIVYYTVGFHPHDAGKFSDDVLIEFQKVIGDGKMLAVGEIGLDFYRNLSPVDQQIKVFEKMLEFARINGKPVIIHNREASDKVSEVIDSVLDADERIGIIHCFNGDRRFLRWALDKGFYISYAGPVTFKKEYELRDTLNYVPLDRLFIETDCPYLSPTPKRGKLNEPANVVFNAYTIKQVKNVSTLKLAEILENNFKLLLER